MVKGLRTGLHKYSILFCYSIIIKLPEIENIAPKSNSNSA